MARLTAGTDAGVTLMPPAVANVGVSVIVPATLPVAVEDNVTFSLNLDKVHCFDGRSGVNVLAR